MAAAPPLPRKVIRRFAQVFATLALMGAILFATAGTVAWPMAWAYLLSFAVVVGTLGGLLARHHPEVIAARSEVQEGALGWDRVLATIIILMAHPVTLVVSGLDHRFSWSQGLATTGQLAALLTGIAAYGLIMWSMASNRHFEGLVRIQTDRDHRVETGGPYRRVRHPGYVGMTINFLALPLALGSTWGLLPATLSVLLLILRTWLEDRTLQRELEGYAAYAERVRFRLVPGLW
jgi:protein-S-isoprenylcysteine O-methyltransferase Ste14